MADEAKLKLLSYNIHFGGIGRECLIADVINHVAPDVVILQEATRPGAVEKIAAETKLSFWGSKDGYSLGFLSRQRPDLVEWHEPPETGRAFLELAIDGSTIYGVHLSATHGNLRERRRAREVQALLREIGSRQPGSHVITGDLNTLAPGEMMDMRKLPRRYRMLAWALGGRLRFRTIQILLEAGYRDGYRSLHTDAGFTFPVREPHVRLDYLFLPAEQAGGLSECGVVTKAPNVLSASDHFPLLSEMA